MLMLSIAWLCTFSWKLMFLWSIYMCFLGVGVGHEREREREREMQKEGVLGK